jgi:hypothetical protein
VGLNPPRDVSILTRDERTRVEDVERPAGGLLLDALVKRAHAQNLWIRFYTLDGFLNDGDGLTKSYDFGSDAAVRLRWRAAIEARADFIATDHYERFDRARRER